MRGRLIRGGLLILAMAGCQQTSPSTPSVQGSPYSLMPGEYTMTIYVPGPSSGINVVCVQENAVPDTASFPVGVSLVTGGWRIQPVGEANLGLVALLAPYSVTVVAGPVFGQARDLSTGVVVSISPAIAVDSPVQTDAWLDGTVANPAFAAGYLAGDVQFALGSAARFCRPVRWMLRKRMAS